jgi:hypothetical protein
MPVESSSQPGKWNCAREALAEIRACPGELQTFVSGVFDQLDGLTNQLLRHERTLRQTQRQAERESVQGEIDRLSAVAAQLAEMMAEQKQLAGQKPRNMDSNA